jgi:hypothetical protein
MYWIGYVLALLATIVVGWALPLIGVAIVLSLLQILYTLQPFVAAGVMVLLTGLLVWYSLHRQAYWQALLWGALWVTGAVMALAGWLNWYALFIESVLLIILLVPGLVTPGWANVLRWFATGELALTLFLLWGQGQGLPGVTLVFSLLLLAIAALIGPGSLRPFEERRLRRRLAALAVLAAALLILWQPVVLPAVHWAGQAAQAAGQAVGQAVAVSPVGRWYRATALQWERQELGEAAKTEALRQLQPTLTEAHKARWEKGIRQIPSLPLSTGEWGDLGVPREADP